MSDSIKEQVKELKKKLDKDAALELDPRLGNDPKLHCPSVNAVGNGIVISDSYGNKMHLNLIVAYRLALKLFVYDFNCRNNIIERIQERDDIDIQLHSTLVEQLTIKINGIEVKMHRHEAFKVAVVIVTNDWMSRFDGIYPLTPTAPYPISVQDYY